MSAAPAIRDPKADDRRQRNRESQNRRRERLRMEKRGIRYVDEVPMMREVIGAAVALGLVHPAAVDDDLRAAHDLAWLVNRVVVLAGKSPSLVAALKLPQE